MRRLPLLLLLAALFSPAGAGAQESGAAEGKEECPVRIYALMPSQGEPAVPAKIYVEGLPPRAELYVNDSRVPYNPLEEGVVSFGLPIVEPGVYPLYFKVRNGCRSNTVSLRVKEGRPVITAMIPTQIYYCTPQEDRVATLKGDHFSRGTKILFDDMVVGSRFVSPKEMEIKIPQARSGLHQIVAVNPGDSASLSHNFYIEGKPVVYDISVGLRYDGHYELIIEGENFLWGAVALVDGKEARGEVVYKGCNMMVYDRIPRSEGPAEISLQVANSDGQKSNLFLMSIP